MQLTRIYVHPLKSGRGIEYSQAYASVSGLLHDREWLVVNEEGMFLTARTHHPMVRIEVELIPGAALFKAPGMTPILAMTHDYKVPVTCQVWRDHFIAYHGDTRLDRWFSTFIEQSCRLLWLGGQSTRQQKEYEEPLSFADGYPYLLVNQASLDALNEELPTPVTSRHFRPNFVIQGADAFEEDEWKQIRIGEVIFEVTKLCSRCMLTTVNPETGIADAQHEPFQTLARIRQLPEGVCFGINLRALNKGRVQAGNEVKVIEGRYTF